MARTQELSLFVRVRIPALKVRECSEEGLGGFVGRGVVTVLQMVYLSVHKLLVKMSGDIVAMSESYLKWDDYRCNWTCFFHS